MAKLQLDSPEFRLFLPAQAVGASLVYWDLFNASGSTLDVYVASVTPIVSGAVAVAGTLAVDLFLTRTSAVGTTGTAATRSGTSLTAATITPMSPGQGECPDTITARLTPGGGATAGGVISWCSLFTEETSDATYVGHTNELVRRNSIENDVLLIPPNSGIRVVQGAVASVGNIGFDVIFRVVKK